MIDPNFFQKILERLFFLWAKIPIPCCPIEWKLPFVPLTPRVPPSSGN